MQYIEAPNETETKAKKLFLAGAITGAPEWQKTVLDKNGRPRYSGLQSSEKEFSDR